MKNYDISIVYRIYPGVSKVPPIFSDNKLKLSELCLSSFRTALAGVNFKLYVILDNCPNEYVNLFNTYFNSEEIEIIEVSKSGNALTFGMQMDILLEQNYSEIIYFAEDDYFYLDGAFQKMLEFMNSDYKPDFITPFDHLDYYRLKLHQYEYNTIEHLGNLWRTASTTCMTFMTTKKILRETEKIFRTYTKNNYDASLWMSLTKMNLNNPKYLFSMLNQGDMYRRIFAKLWIYGLGQVLFGRKYKLYSPRPSLSTHMDNLCLAPDINWDLEFAKLLTNFNFSE